MINGIKCPNCGSTKTKQDGMCVAGKVDQYFCEACGFAWDVPWSQDKMSHIASIRVKCIVATEEESKILSSFIHNAQMFALLHTKATASFSFEIEVNPIEAAKRH